MLNPKGLTAKVDEMDFKIDKLNDQIATLIGELRSRPAQTPIGNVASPLSRTFYSVEEVSKLVGRSAYSVREWARNGQVSAIKRSERRGGAALWSISAAEVARYQNEGLLPMDPDRNNRN